MGSGDMEECTLLSIDNAALIRSFSFDFKSLLNPKSTKNCSYLWTTLFFFFFVLKTFSGSLRESVVLIKRRFQGCVMCVTVS